MSKRAHARVIEITPAIVAAAYGSGDVIGGVNDVPRFAELDGGSALLQSVGVIDNSDQKAAIDLYFFNDTVSPGANNSPFTLSAADAQKFLGKLSIAGASYTSEAGGHAHSMATGVGILMETLASQTNIKMVVVSRGTPTYTAADNLKILLGVIGA